MLTLPEAPVLNFNDEELELIVKSGVAELAAVTVTLMSMVRVRSPPTPLTVIMCGPGDTVLSALRVMMEVWGEPLLGALNVAEKPTTGFRLSPMIPVKPLTGSISMVVCCDEPCLIVRVEGLAVREKSGVGGVTVTYRIDSWNVEPLVPITPTT
jgi:hypothetical protein